MGSSSNITIKAQKPDILSTINNISVDLRNDLSHLSLETRRDNSRETGLNNNNGLIDKKKTNMIKISGKTHHSGGDKVEASLVLQARHVTNDIMASSMNRTKIPLKNDSKRINIESVPKINSNINSVTSISNVIPLVGAVGIVEVKEEEEEEESSEISVSDEDGSWIAWFCSLRGNEFFCEVDEDYIQDDFNLTGLNILVPYYDYALDMVLDVEIPMEDSLTEEQQEIVESAAEMLYGLIHARYIVTNRGMHAMYEKYRSAAFGRCPRVFCLGQPVLPVGLSDLPRKYTVNVFCPRCHGLFFPKSTRQSNIDGSYFGTTFPHLYLMTHPDIIPEKPTQHYQPCVYGFKVHKSSVYYRNHEDDQTIHNVIGRDRLSKKNRFRSKGGR